MDLGLEGRRAAVAAASGGLGYASAAALVAAGARVAICSRDRDRVDRGGRAPRAAARSASSPTSARPRARGVRGRRRPTASGGVDILVTNAGGPPPGTFASTDLEAYLPALELNLLSVVAMCTAAVPAMQARHWGRVVAITSIAVRQPIPTLILSNTARAGVTGFLKTLATEVARRRRDRELGAARATTRPTGCCRSTATGIRPVGRRQGHPGRHRSATRTTSGRSWRSSAPSRPGSSPASSSRSTAGTYLGLQ